ncbi:MAG: IS1182 family transposase [Cyanobacteria bacterium J06600_6]
MSLHPKSIPSVPEATAQVARAAFPKGNIYLQIRDTLGSIYVDEDFADLFSVKGQPAQSPWRLALICVMQYMENLSDRQAADAVRGRIDWKYALSLPLEDSGFDFSALSEFRKRLIEGGSEELLLNRILEQLREKELLKGSKRQRTDSTHILAAIRPLNRLETLGETMRAALNSLAIAAPDWLAKRIKKDWFDRYGRRVENYRLPKLDSERETLGNQMGEDGFNLLEKVYAPNASEWLRLIPAVETLRQVWVQQFYAPVEGQVKLRSPSDMPPSTIAIHSPYDVEAHYSSKRSVNWVGYKAHLTEICDRDTPHFITHVQTTLSTVTDEAVVEPIHQALSSKSLLPEEHLMDLGYITAGHLVSAQENYGIELIGPVRNDPTWQAKHHPKFANSNFQINWDKQVAVCPRGHQSKGWKKKTDSKGQPLINIRFSQLDCSPCPSRSRCTRAKIEPRGLTILPKPEYTALHSRREVQHTPKFLKTYNKRAGIEGTISQGVRRSALRQSRYVGLAKTHLQHILIAVGLNLCRLNDWLNDFPLATTRYSGFMTLKPKAS